MSREFLTDIYIQSTLCLKKRTPETFYYNFAKIALTLSPPIPLRLYTLPYWSNPPFLIFDIRALWRSGVEN